MSLVAEGHGFTVTYGDLDITQKPITIEIPEAARESIPRTTQSNTAVHTSQVSALAKYADITDQFPWDPVDHAAFIASGTTSFARTVTFPSSGGTHVTYVAVKSVSAPKAETGNRPTYDVVFEVTNLNGTTETAPAYSAGS